MDPRGVIAITTENRAINRDVNGDLEPVRAMLKFNNAIRSCHILNFHFKGMGIQVDELTARELKESNQTLLELSIYQGNQILHESLAARVAWNDLDGSCSLGLEFINIIEEWKPRAARIRVNDRFPISIVCEDPIFHDRKVFLTLEDASVTGLLLCTSLSNKHLFPGMTLRSATIRIQSEPDFVLDLPITSARQSDKAGEFYIGVSLPANVTELYEALTRYFSTVVENGLERAIDAGLHREGEKIKHAGGKLTYAIVKSEQDYDEVLKLRFLGYSKHGKVLPGSTWKDQGEGLANEGLIVAARLAGSIVAACELRFSDGPVPFRFFRSEDIAWPDWVQSNKLIEVNKLVIAPHFQGSDVLLSMFQLGFAYSIKQGCLDFICCATNKLTPTYELIGFRKIGVRVPHPTLKDQSLNLLVMSSQTYLSGKGVNPYTWDQVFSAVQAQSSSIGLTKLATKGLIHKVVSRTIGLAHRLTEKTKDSPATGTLEKGEPVRFINPNLTKQHISTAIFVPYIHVSDEIIGPSKTNRILRDSGLSRDYFRNKGAWVSLDFFDSFIDRFKQYGDANALQRRAGEQAWVYSLSGGRFIIFRYLYSIRKIFESIETAVNPLNRTRRMVTTSVADGKAKISIGLSENMRMPKDVSSCLNFEYNFRRCLELKTGKPGVVTKVSCCYNGDSSCNYELVWDAHAERRYNKRGSIIATSIGVFLLSASISGLFLDIPHYRAVIPWVWLGFFVLLTSLMVQLLHVSGRLLHTLRDEFHIFEQESNTRYALLQEAKMQAETRYQEARLLEETSESIQTLNDVNTMLDKTLKDTCTRFQFDRAFLMLVTPDRKLLKTASVYCTESDLDMIWRFTVDLTVKREQGFFVSSIFHSGQPVFIDNVEDHLFHLNDVSREIITRLGSKTYAMVPVPGANGRLGVLIADRVDSKQMLVRSDMVLLERIARQLGMGLDKQTQLDHERNMRIAFQKYVPRHIVDEIAAERGGVRGGTTGEIVSMILDIRNFTVKSKKISPAALLNWLNKFYENVVPLIEASDGYVERYLGDGFLATWGSIDRKAVDLDRVLQSALDVLASLDGLNRIMASLDLPEIQVGMGVARGQAVSGNVGSANRIQFTSLGTVVNFSARLEELCKSLGVPLVVSIDFYNGLSQDMKEKMTVVSDVGVDSFADVMAIAALKVAKESERVA